MPIPHAELATIPPEKLRSYLLNPDHPVGGPKARWFIAMGYRPDNPQRLADDLLSVARDAKEFVTENTANGVKYIARGAAISPTERQVRIVAVWIIEPDAIGPRLVTAYPDKKSRP